MLRSNLAFQACLAALLFAGDCGAFELPSFQSPPPAQIQGSKPGTPGVTDYSSLLDHFRGLGVAVEPAGQVEQPFFSVKGQVIQIDADHLQVFEYENAAAAEKEAGLVAPDGMTIGTSKPHWLGPPHFYKKGKLIVLYLGNSPKILQLLSTSLGPQFAGR